MSMILNGIPKRSRHKYLINVCKHKIHQIQLFIGSSYEKESHKREV